jgi:enamine deaminase RidA (YjgF/YER057c/UK114 family)
MNEQKKKIIIMHKESTNQFGQLENVDTCIKTTQTAKEMRRYLKMDDVKVWTIWIEDLKKTMINAFEDIGENKHESSKVVETKTKILG